MTKIWTLSGWRFRDGRARAVTARLTEFLGPDLWRAAMDPPDALRAGDRLRFGEASENQACLLGFLDAEAVALDNGLALRFAFAGPALEEALERLAQPTRTEREAATMETEWIWTALANSRAEAILAVDRAGAITFWNPGAERIFGFSAQEALGASLDLIIPEALRARHNAGFEQAMASGATRYGDGDLLSVPAIRKDGGRLSAQFTVSFVKTAEGSVAGMVAILRDGSKTYEELKNLRRALADCGARS